ncbi:uncharacterized protein LOC135487898 isoform X3 [Lineus longissimus]|uniref:uncharacterized protein LOC135487898 isoform X3 n=1 Tax=Lineus longissimus TaxID=88925 RepID=UPI00315C7A51
MAQERVTITGDIIDDFKSEGDPSEPARENMLVGMIESTSELVEESCIVDGRFKEVIREKGSLMSQTWTDLFSLMNQYEAELVNKSGEIDIREAKLKSEESRLNLSALKSSEPSPVIAVLQQDNVEKDEKIMTYMGEINSLEKELAELRKELQLKDFHIQTIEKELASKDVDISGHEQRIKVLDRRILDLSAEIKNKDFVISQVSKQVRSMATPGGKSCSRQSRKRPILVTSGSAKVLRTGDDSASAISLRASPRQSSSSQKNDNSRSSPEDSAEDDPKDTDYILEGGAESVDDDFDNPEPEPSTSDDLVKVKTEPTEDMEECAVLELCNAESYKHSDRSGHHYHKGRMHRHVDDVVRLTGRHYPVKAKMKVGKELSTGRQSRSQKRCRVCYARGIKTERGSRVETVWICDDCPSKPGLCVNQGCFKIYHTELDFANSAE